MELTLKHRFIASVLFLLLTYIVGYSISVIIMEYSNLSILGITLGLFMLYLYITYIIKPFKKYIMKELISEIDKRKLQTNKWIKILSNKYTPVIVLAISIPIFYIVTKISIVISTLLIVVVLAIFTLNDICEEIVNE